MQTGPSTIKGIFDASRIFSVPIYQRAYSWDKENHLPYFFNDLFNQQPGRAYFFGTFLFQITGKRGDFDQIEIIDGQQRLTTTVIFLDVLIKRLISIQSNKVTERTYRKFIKEDDVYKLELATDDCLFLHQNVLGGEETVKGEINTESKRLLLEANTYFTTCLQNLNQGSLERIYETLTEAEVLQYVVKEISSATQIFELLNDRGKKLTNLESIKSFLMYNMGLVSNHPEQLIKNIQDHFAAIYRLIETNGLDDNEVLRYHTIAFERESEERPKKFIKEKISKLINSGKKEEAKTVIEDYTRSLRRSFELYHSIKNNTYHSDTLDRLFMINRIGPYYPVIMHTLKHNPGDFSALLEALSTFTFKAAITGLRSYGESQLYNDLKHGNNTLHKLLGFSEHNWWDINRRVKDALVMDNYYDRISKNLVKYILFSYENALREQKGFPLLSRKDYDSNDSRKKLNIEHITAKRAKGVIFDEEFKERYLNNLGNLVIDSTASNSSKNANNTADKLPQFQAAPVMSQNEIDGKSIDWSNLAEIKQFIEQRERNLRYFIIHDILKEKHRYHNILSHPAVIPEATI